MSTSDELIKQREELNAKIDKALKAEKTNIALLFVNCSINIFYEKPVINYRKKSNFIKKITEQIKS